jgi:hypothetical protein
MTGSAGSTSTSTGRSTPSPTALSSLARALSMIGSCAPLADARSVRNATMSATPSLLVILSGRGMKSASRM